MSKFSELNESSLHHSLKILYAEENQGTTEVELDNQVYDVLSKENEIIEIQTKNLSSLQKKVEKILEKNKKIRIIHPIFIKKDIELYNKDNELIKKTHSSKKGSIYDIFKELTKLYPYLLNPNFRLEILEIHGTEKRIKLDNLSQSKNRRRRFLKDYQKIDKSLQQIINKRIFYSKEDYLSLLPSELPEEFSSAELKKCLKNSKDCPARIYNNSNIILWLFLRMNLIKICKTQGRKRFYKINK